jgi:RNA polymerase sigma factor (TIGR02999 family)
MSDVTRILSNIEAGDTSAAEQLLPLVYDELRKLAAARLAREKPGQTLQPTSLVHEAYLRLVMPPSSPPPQGGEGGAGWNSRGHFFGAAAEAMRRILVENARSKAAQKRGGRRGRVSLDVAEPALPEASDDLLALNEALDKLAAADADAAKLVNLRYFAGLTLPQAAESMGISPRSADRLWAYARAFLLRTLHGK